MLKLRKRNPSLQEAASPYDIEAMRGEPGAITWDEPEPPSKPKPKVRVVQSIKIQVKKNPKAKSSAKDTPAEKFCKRVWNMSQQHPLLSRGVIFNGTVVLEISPCPIGWEKNDTEGRYVHLSSIVTLDPKKGYASEAMKKLIAMAKEDGIYLEGTAKAFGSGKEKLSTAKLKQWYKRLGAKITRGDSLLWTP